MRHALLAAALSLLAALQAAAFEIEAFETFETPAADQRLKIISTTDLAVFRPVIRAFQAAHPRIAIDYTAASSSELMKAIHDEGAVFDLALSSAMDLQTKLANDGFARTYVSEATLSLPDWARWRDQVIAFTQEPAVMIVSEAAFAGLAMPTSRADLIALLRANEDRFRGRIGTYDIRASGLGYLFATQDSRKSESYWQLMEMFGRLDARLYCCSSTMISDVLQGRLALAYNALGSYADRRLADTTGARVVLLEDFTNLMLRSAVVTSRADNAEAAGAMVDFLVSGRRGAARALPPVRPDAADDEKALRPIGLGPELLVFLDSMRRRNFLRAWTRSLEQ